MEGIMQPEIPTTKEEVEQAIKAMVGDNDAGRAMCGIFRCHMAMGKPLLEAYEEALKAYVKHADARNAARPK